MINIIDTEYFSTLTVTDGTQLYTHIRPSFDGLAEKKREKKKKKKRGETKEEKRK